MKYTTKRPVIHRARFRAVYVFAPFLLAGLVLLGAGASAALARTDVPPPAGPSLESWVPPAYALGDPYLTELERQAYADDYHAMLSGGTIETTNSATLEDTQRVTGVLDNGQAPGQDGNTAALYQDGVLVWGQADPVPAEGAQSDSGSVDPVAWHGNIEADDAVYIGYVDVRATGQTGLKCAVNVANRSTLRDYQLLMAYNPDNGSDLFAIEIAEYTEGVFKPFLHIKCGDGSEFTKWYTAHTASAGWHNLRMERSQANGTWTVWYDTTQLDSNLYWPTSIYNYYTRAQVEGFYETQYQTVWDPANHHGDIYARTSNDSTWSKWTNSLWGSYKYGGWWAELGASHTPIADKYSSLQYQYSPDFYDWMLRR